MNVFSNNIRILVTGAGGPAGVNALRLLGRQSGVEVYATDCDALSVGKCFAKDFRVMAMVKDAEAYKDDLLSMIHDWSINVVIPTVSEELIVIRTALESASVHVIACSQETLERCHDKAVLYAYLATHLPEYIANWQVADAPPLFQAEEYFVKPRVGRGGRGCNRMAKQEREALVGRPEAQQLIAMEVLPGTEWTVDAYVAKDGSIPLLVPRERLALLGGICVKGKTVKQAEVVAASLRVLGLLPCYGPVCLQWKSDHQGKSKLIEINPRLSGGVMISALAGADPIACLVQDVRTGSVASLSWDEITVARYLDEKIV